MTRLLEAARRALAMLEKVDCADSVLAVELREAITEAEAAKPWMWAVVDPDLGINLYTPNREAAARDCAGDGVVAFPVYRHPILSAFTAFETSSVCRRCGGLGFIGTLECVDGLPVAQASQSCPDCSPAVRGEKRWDAETLESAVSALLKLNIINDIDAGTSFEELTQALARVRSALLDKRFPASPAPAERKLLDVILGYPPKDHHPILAEAIREYEAEMEKAVPQIISDVKQRGALADEARHRIAKGEPIE